jgi:lauroyl/myristoyl acyltransferase
VVARHLELVLGRALAADERKRLVRATFASYARYWAESLRLPNLSPAVVTAGMRFEGFEHVDVALAHGKGLIVVLPHLGGWDWGGCFLAGSGRPVTVVVEPLRPPEVFQWFTEFRRGLGMQVVPVGPAAGSAVLKALAQGQVVCLLADRVVAGATGVDVTLFGEPTQLPAGPVTLALRSGAPLICAAVYFGTGGDDHLAFVRPPLALARSGRLRDDVAAGTRALAAELEVLIRREPTQWHLLQPNWPADPPLRAPRWRAALAGKD